jgi:hypothetical protein
VDNKNCPKYFPRPEEDVLTKPMRQVPERTVFTVLRLEGSWAVEHQGMMFGHASEKEVAKAWAHKRAREVVDGGGAAQVLVRGEGLLR